MEWRRILVVTVFGMISWIFLQIYKKRKAKEILRDFVVIIIECTLIGLVMGAIYLLADVIFKKFGC